VLTCARCGQQNPDGFRFCGACAAPLQPTASPAEERKLVTVIFCDLVGFTARSDRADPEDVRATLRPYHALLRREIERYGGTIEKFIGDAIMAVFGAPVAHEDDAERAVRAGLRIIEELRAAGSGTDDIDLSVRIGVNSGEAVVALGARPDQGEGIVTGDVVNTAARLQTSGAPDSVVVGELTYRATRDVFEYEELEPATAKGKQDPVPRWRAVRAKSRFGIDVDQFVRTRLIGRDAELELLEDAFRRTTRDATPQLVTLTGEPGVGKTRLVWEFGRFIDGLPQLVYWRQGRCLPYGEGITFWALGEIVKAQAGIVETDDPEQASAKVAEAVRLVAGRDDDDEWLKARLAPLVGGIADGGASGRDESFAAWRRFIELVAARDPLVVVFEDLHWADPTLIEFIDHLVDWSSGVPLLVLCTGRPELYDRHPGWGGGKRNSATIALAPLASHDTARLVSELLSQAVLPADLQATLIERSGGNPLYTEEFVKMLIDRRVLARSEDGGTWRMAEGHEPALPESLQALIAARLDTLPPEQKSVLQDASVLGKVFWSGGVAAMSGIEEGEVRRRLQGLVRREFVRPARTSSMSGQAEYAFWHVLIRDVAHGQIPRATRAKKHRAAAEWIEQIAGERVIDHADFLAHHYLEAFELGRAAGEDTEPLRAPLGRALTLAGDRARHLDAAKAASFYSRALEIIPETSDDHAGLMVKAMGAAWDGGTLPVEQVVAGYEAAVDELRGRDDVEGAASAMLKMVHPVWMSGDTARAMRITRDVIEMAGPERKRLLATAYSMLAARLNLAGDLEESMRMADRALEISQPNNLHEVTARALQWRGTGRCVFEDPKEGLADLREALDIVLRHGFVTHANPAFVNLADMIWDEEGPAAGLEVYRRGLEYSESRGMNAGAMWTQAEMTWVLYAGGDWDECVRLADELIERDRAIGGSQVGVIALGSKADVLLARGRLQEAAELSAAALPRAITIHDPQVLVPALVTAAIIDAELGRRSDAAPMIKQTSRAFKNYFLPGAVRALVRTGDLEGAEAYLEEMIAPLLTRTRNGEIAARAMLAEARGELDEAARLHAGAAGAWASFGYPYEQAQSLVALARCVTSLGRAAEAVKPLTEARGILAELRALPLLAETARMLEDADAAG
jgi:class 3 adenylate cyclase/tetratricopeptide (TPR) repeat protein